MVPIAYSVEEERSLCFEYAYLSDSLKGLVFSFWHYKCCYYYYDMCYDVRQYRSFSKFDSCHLPKSCEGTRYLVSIIEFIHINAKLIFINIEFVQIISLTGVIVTVDMVLFISLVMISAVGFRSCHLRIAQGPFFDDLFEEVVRFSGVFIISLFLAARFSSIYLFKNFAKTFLSLHITKSMRTSLLLMMLLNEVSGDQLSILIGIQLYIFIHLHHYPTFELYYLLLSIEIFHVGVG